MLLLLKMKVIILFILSFIVKENKTEMDLNNKIMVFNISYSLTLLVGI